jgi:hypothetical protein
MSYLGIFCVKLRKEVTTKIVIGLMDSPLNSVGLFSFACHFTISVDFVGVSMLK